MKRLMSAVLFAICATFLCGCATIDYSHYVNGDGSIVDSVLFTIDSDVSPSVAYSLVEDIADDVMDYYVKPLRQVRNALYVDDSIRKGIEVEVVKNNTTAFDEYVRVTTTCANSQMFEILNTQILPQVYVQNKSLAESDESKTGYSVGAFIIRYIEKTTSAFGDVSKFELQLNGDDEAVNFADKYSQRYAGGEYHFDKSGTFDSSDIKLTQTYASPDNRLKSNADAVMYFGGLKFHKWELDASNPNFELEFFYETANPIGWYYLALGIAGGVVVALLIVYGVIKIKNRKKVHPNGEYEIKDFDETNKDF